MKASSTRAGFLSSWHLPAFLLAAAVVYAVEVFAVHRVGSVSDPDLLAVAVALDLTLFVPLLYWLLLVRGRGWPLATVLPVFVAGFLGARAVLPAGREGALRIVELLAIPVELFVIGFLVHRVRAAARGGPAETFPERLRHAAFELLGSRFAADALATEISVLYYGAFAWRRRPPDDSGAFSVHRRTAYPAIAGALALAVVAETFAVHFLVRMWSPGLAWVLTALSVYSLLWIAADVQAIRLRPVRVTGDGVTIRVGLRGSVEVPFAKIAGFGGEGPAHRMVPLGAPNVRLDFTEPLEVSGIYGLRKWVRAVAFAVDEPERFRRACATTLM